MPLTRRSALQILGLTVATTRPDKLVAQSIEALQAGAPSAYVFDLNKVSEIHLEFKGTTRIIKTQELFQALKGEMEGD